jgi:2-oxoisovalerate dehydrogenase E1 component
MAPVDVLERSVGEMPELAGAAGAREPVVEIFERDPHGKPVLPLSPEKLYAFGHLIRITEQLILDLFGQGLLSGTTHTCIGQELCQMGVVRALQNPRDVVLSNHRNHGHFLTYSGDVLGLLAEVMGREAGVCGGAGGSQHIAHRHFHSNGVQAGMTAIGVGQALARSLAKDDSIVAAIIGDGTLGEGLLYESLNLSSIWKLPILFVVEHNHIAQTTETARTIGGSIVARGEAFGLQTWRLDDADKSFFEQTQKVVDTVRRSRLPGLLVIDTRRLGPHSKGDDLRPAAEIEAIRKRDPLLKMGERISPKVRGDIERGNIAYLKEVRQAASVSPPARYVSPPLHVFGPSCRPVVPARLHVNGALAGTVRSALNGSLRRLLETSDKTLILGEDLHDPYGGAFKVTQGLSSAFPDRVISTPISEAAVVGAGIGLALAGYRPVIEVMFADFLTLAADQIYNHAVKFAALFPSLSVPLVIRTPSGGRRGYGPTHSQSPESIFVSVPGLTVVFPTHRHDVAELLASATLCWDYPVVFFEHKLLYGVERSPGEYQIVPPVASDPAAELFPTLRAGSVEPDVTLVAYGGMLPIVEEVAGQLHDQEELEVEIVALSLLAPLPRQCLTQLLARRPRVVVVEESQAEFGVGAAIGALLVEAGFQGAFLRIGSPPVPIPSARSLEQDILPDKAGILRRILSLF